MTTPELLLSSWDWEPSVIIGCLLLQAAYLVFVRGHINRTTVLFTGGVLTMFLALVSPLDGLGDDYLFSAHMVQHMLLDFVAPLFFVLGLPAEQMRRVLHWPPLDRLERWLGYPVLAWVLGNFTLWIWHVPVLYNATLENEAIHIFEHLTLLVTGTIMWWPVFTTMDERRLRPMRGAIYVAALSLSNGLLGIIYTFLTTPLYPAYVNPEDPRGALSLIRGQWGLDPVTDQQLGGAVMWVMGGVIGLATIVMLVNRWYHEINALEVLTEEN